VSPFTRTNSASSGAAAQAARTLSTCGKNAINAIESHANIVMFDKFPYTPGDPSVHGYGRFVAHKNQIAAFQQHYGRRLANSGPP
jgi:hypothetical protein